MDEELKSIIVSQLGELTLQCAFLGRRVKELEAELIMERAKLSEANEMLNTRKKKQERRNG